MADDQVIMAWGGFVDGRLYLHDPAAGTYDEPRYAIFPTRKAARKSYSDTRPVEIVIRPA